MRENSGEIEWATQDLDEPPTCYICLEGGEGLVRACNCRWNSGFSHSSARFNVKTLSPQNSFSFGGARVEIVAQLHGGDAAGTPPRVRKFIAPSPRTTGDACGPWIRW